MERSASKPIILALPTLVLSKNDMRKRSARIGRILGGISERVVIVLPELTVYPTSIVSSVPISAGARGRHIDRGEPTSPLRALTLLTWVGP